MPTRDEVMKGLYEHVIPGHAAEAKALTQAGIDMGLSPRDMLYGSKEEGLIPALEEVGARFESGEFFVPEMLIAARAMQGAVALIRPLLVESGVKPIATYVIATVKGDMHDIGKNLCGMMLEGAGFNMVDLGVNTSTDKIIAAIEEHKAELLGFSAFLTTTMPMFKVNMEALTRAGLRDRVKVMVGGAPVTEEYAVKSGADGYAPDANTCVRVAKELLGLSPRAESEDQAALGDAMSALGSVMQKVGEAEAAESAGSEGSGDTGA